MPAAARRPATSGPKRSHLRFSWKQSRSQSAVQLMLLSHLTCRGCSKYPFLPRTSSADDKSWRIPDTSHGAHAVVPRQWRSKMLRMQHRRTAAHLAVLSGFAGPSAHLPSPPSLAPPASMPSMGSGPAAAAPASPAATCHGRGHGSAECLTGAFELSRWLSRKMRHACPVPGPQLVENGRTPTTELWHKLCTTVAHQTAFITCLLASRRHCAAPAAGTARGSPGKALHMHCSMTLPFTTLSYPWHLKRRRHVDVKTGRPSAAPAPAAATGIPGSGPRSESRAAPTSAQRPASSSSRCSKRTKSAG